MGGQKVAGCIMELADDHQIRQELLGGETRCFLEIGDELILRARGSCKGRRTFGFGECRGIIAPSKETAD